jgi:hypothetical protein
MPSMESNYVLNVSRKASRMNFYGGQYHPIFEHFCRIELGAGLPENVKERAREIAERFPAPLFQCELTYWECLGHRVEL